MMNGDDLAQQLNDRISPILEVGDIVRMVEPYRPLDYLTERKQHGLDPLPDDWKGFTYGVVVEITSTELYGRSPSNPGRREPRNISLHLYDDNGMMYIYPCYLAEKHMVPAYVDCHRSECVWYRRAKDQGSHVIPNPPDWSL